MSCNFLQDIEVAKHIQRLGELPLILPLYAPLFPLLVALDEAPKWLSTLPTKRSNSSAFELQCFF